MHITDLLPSFILSLISVFFYMSYWFLVSRILNRVDVVDIAWGIGYVLIALSTLVFNKQYFIQPLILTTMVLIWGFRLSIHIYAKNANKNEDPRYTKLTKKWKHPLRNIFLKIFMFQGVLITVISTPIIITNIFGSSSFTFFNFLGVSIWILGFYFEALGDYQLKKFISNKYNKGKVMNKGLWKYTRHPNYFGEVTMWWGIFVYTLNLPFSFIGIISPIIITLLILKISGIPMAEEQMKNLEGFKEYKKTTSVFFPLTPRQQ